MGNHRFRLSDMMPNAWFYKLRDMGRGGGVLRGQQSTTKTRTHHPPKPSTQPTPPKPQPYLPNRPSYYFSSRAEEQKLPCSPIHHPKASDTHFPIDSPTKSKTRPTRIKPSTKLITSAPAHRQSEQDIDDINPCPHCLIIASATDIIIDMSGGGGCNSKISSSETLDHFDEDFGTASQLQLPPILTKPAMKAEQPPRKDGKILINTRTPARRSPPGIPRLRLRPNSPRLANRRIQAHRGRKSSAGAQQTRAGLPESFAVVKKSSDPQRDFRDSMVEMIVENNIRAPKDLEELLACYLSLNSNEYHDLIVKVFAQIWFDLTDIRH